MRRHGPPGVALVFGLVGLGCGPGPPEAPRDSMLDSAGVRIVTNVGPDVDLDPVEVRRIGTADGDAETSLFRVQAVELDERDQIWVGSGDGTIRVFGADGAFVRQLGGRGDGPGEFRMINKLFRTPGGMAAVDWQGGGRVSVFSVGGELRDNWRGTWGASDFVFPEAFLDGEWLGLVYEGNSASTDPGVTENRRGVRAMAPPPGGGGSERVGLPPRLLYESDAVGLDWPLFVTDPSVAFGGARRVFVSVEGPYAVWVYDAAGMLLLSMRRDVEPVPLSEADVQEFKEKTREFIMSDDRIYQGNGGRTGLERALARVDAQASLPGPSAMSPIGRVLASPSGVVWAERRTGSPAQIEHLRTAGGYANLPEVPSRWDLFDENGWYHGTVELPARFRALTVTDSTVTGVMKDELDLEYVVTYSVGPR